MNAILAAPLPELPEWRRSGRYLFLAVLIHLAVLAYPLKLAIGKLDLPPVSAVVVSFEKAAAPLPLALPPVAAPSPPSPVPVRELRSPKARPVLAMAPQESSAVTPFAVPAPAAVAAPVTTEKGPPAPAPSVTAARFDAAYLHNPRPNYPPLSRRLGEEGKVLLKVQVSAEGRALSVELAQGSHFERLDEAARQAVSRWRFVPAKRGDEAIEASVIVPIVFRLED